MAIPLTKENVGLIAEVLGVSSKQDGECSRLEMIHEPSGRRLAIEIRFNLTLPNGLSDTPTTLVSVYGTNSFHQLHGCSRFIASKELGEVIFFAKHEGTTSGLVVEREAASSLYANVDDRLFSSDFMELPAELIMSSVALSMTDTLFDDLG
jgi:hypothetical protein